MLLVSEGESKPGQAKWHLQDTAGLRVASDDVWFYKETPFRKLPRVANRMRKAHDEWKVTYEKEAQEQEDRIRVKRTKWEIALVVNLLITTTTGLKWKDEGEAKRLKDLIANTSSKKEKVKILTTSIQESLATHSAEHHTGSESEEATKESDGGEGEGEEFLMMDSE
jgi:hypothetical protein